MQPTSNESAEKIRSGEYFREAFRAYADVYLDPIGERYFYLAIIIISLVASGFLLLGISSLYPLSPAVPFIYVSQDINEELPSIARLREQGESVNVALKRYLVSEYVQRRESYDINQIDTNARVVRGISSDAVYNAWQQEIAPSNPQSPIALYQRHTVRFIRVVSATPLQDGTFDVEYYTYYRSVAGEAPKTGHYIANVAFRYAEIGIDQHNGKKTPLDFTVTGYQTRKLEE